MKPEPAVATAKSRADQLLNNLLYSVLGLSIGGCGVLAIVQALITNAWTASRYLSPTPNMSLHQLLDDISGVWIFTVGLSVVLFVALAIITAIRWHRRPSGV